MSEILSVPVGTDWVDVYDYTGITVGVALEVMVDGLYGVRIQESATEPTTPTEGKPMTDVGFGYATATVLTGSDKVWVRCGSEIGTTVAVQERV